MGALEGFDENTSLDGVVGSIVVAVGRKLSSFEGDSEGGSERTGGLFEG